MTRWAPAALAFAVLAVPGAAAAEGLTETLPAGTALLDEGLYLSNLSQMYDDQGRLRPLIPDIVRYEPGGGWQGTIIPDARARYTILVSQLQVGLLDDLSVALAVPVVISNTVRPALAWVPGDYQPTIGRPYSEEDFWSWAASMGQPRPGNWSGNAGTLSDIVLGLRWRFSDRIPALSALPMALTVYGALPTGSPPDPEEVVAAGTTSWDLHAQGELGAHLAVDETLGGPFDGRLTISAEVFYEAFFRHTYDTPRGERNPLLLDYAPYVGPTYTIDPGDFWGGSLQVGVVAVRGPALATWLSGCDAHRAERFPPLVAASVRYTRVQLGATDWASDSSLWDWEHERNWKAGDKNVLTGQLTLSLLRVGVPAQLYVRYRNLTWIGGHNSRAADVWTFGVQVPARLWGQAR